MPYRGRAPAARGPRTAARYAVIGGGKTGIDAVLFLLDQNVPPDLITWVVPRDAWLYDRAVFDPRRVSLFFVRQMELFAATDGNLDETLLGLDFRVSAGAFFQARFSRYPLPMHMPRCCVLFEMIATFFLLSPNYRP